MYLPWWFHSKFFRSTSSYVRTATKKCLTRILGIDCIPKMASTNCGFAVTRAPTRSCCFSKHLLRWNQIKIQYFSPRLRNHNFCYLIYLNPIYLRLPMCAFLFFLDFLLAAFFPASEQFLHFCHFANEGGFETAEIPNETAKKTRRNGEQKSRDQNVETETAKKMETAKI